MAFLKIILIIVIIYYFLKFFLRLVFPYILKYYLKKIQNNFHQNTTTYNHKKEGEISVDYFPDDNKIKKHNDNIGEYVDYEEIK